MMDQKIYCNYELGSKFCQVSSDTPKQSLTKVDHLVQLLMPLWEAQEICINSDACHERGSHEQKNTAAMG